LLQRLSPHFDWILIDTPPVAPLTDAVTLAQHVDGCLLVVRADYTPREAVEEAMKLLGPRRVLGMLFNGAEGLNQLYSQYYGYYGKK
jgi:Mrp family chromosome partitioning ATPase